MRDASTPPTTISCELPLQHYANLNGVRTYMPHSTSGLNTVTVELTVKTLLSHGLGGGGEAEKQVAETGVRGCTAGHLRREGRQR